MGTIVCKFGGSSLSTARKILETKRFIEANPDRRYVVVSAPGKRFPGDVKVTDLLRECIRVRSADGNWKTVFDAVTSRFDEIIAGLPIDLDLSSVYADIGRIIAWGDPTARDFIESRGEYLMAVVVSKAYGYSFNEAADLVKFDRRGFNAAFTNSLVQAQFARVSRAVIPGYYGSMLDDATRIKVFSRGGSDITGAIIARGVGAILYENCTDVAGVLECNPGIVPEAQTIREITYQEVRELAYMGASVLHPDALLPVSEAGIPTRVLNPLAPDSDSTFISDSIEHRKGSVVGIAGRGGFSVISIKQSSMNPEVGFASSILGILVKHNVSLEHMPGSLDSLSLIIDGAYRGELLGIIDKMQARYPDADITVKHGMSLIAFVGEGMVRVPGSLASIAQSLANARVNVSMVNQGASEMMIMIGVDDCDAEAAIRATYRDCIAAARDALADELSL